MKALTVRNTELRSDSSTSRQCGAVSCAVATGMPPPPANAATTSAAAELLADLPLESFSVALLGAVGPHRERSAPALGDAVRDLREGLLVAADKHHGGTVGGERLRGRGADAA